MQTGGKLQPVITHLFLQRAGILSEINHIHNILFFSFLNYQKNSKMTKKKEGEGEMERMDPVSNPQEIGVNVFLACG